MIQRGMKRRLFSVLAALSLLLCVAMLAFRVRSYWVGDLFYWTSMSVVAREPEYPAMKAALWRLLGFGYWSSTHGVAADMTRDRMIWFPLWFAAALFALLPALWIGEQKKGHCYFSKNKDDPFSKIL